MAEDNKKERVLHTRITPDLDQQIREKAGSMGISVSNLVRNILGNTVDLVEDIVSDSAQLARSTRTRPEQTSTGETPASGTQAEAGAGSGQGRIVGWQEAVLNLNAVCNDCNKILTKGSRAAIGIVDGNGPRPTICLNCLKEITHDNETEANDG
ncbi:MAG: hypothetical protein SWH61_01125 [Thermodesulfobacteriota bacterium]|nr:hypothetical protein [Thermodesulfobacteriota bacterium]